MKAFVIFPAICVFLLVLALMIVYGKLKLKDVLLWTFITTAVFGGLMTWLSHEMFHFLYYSNFFGVLVCIPCLTFLMYRVLYKNINGRINWLHLLGLGILSTFLTVTIAVLLILLSFFNNPMDPQQIILKRKSRTISLLSHRLADW